MPLDLFFSLLIGTTAGIILNVFYISVKHAWPSNYLSMDDRFDLIISRSPKRYAIFRFGPPVLTVAAAGVTADSVGAIWWIACPAAFAVHASRLVKAIRYDLRNNQRSMAIGHTLLGLVLLVFCALAALFHGIFAFLVPSPEELNTSLWTALFAAVVAVYFQRVVLSPESIRLSTLRVMAGLSTKVIGAIHHQAQRFGLDVRVILALTIAESLQRPRWFRKLEFALPGDKSLRTTGVLQQPGASSDEDSIAKLGDQVIGPIMLDDPNADSRSVLSRIISVHNSDPRFQETVMQVFNVLLDSSDREVMKRLSAVLKP